MKARLLALSALIFVGLSTTLFGLYQYSTTPGFCQRCHFMRPYVASWRKSSHRKVGCLACHFEPGAQNELREKWRSLNQFTSYITQSYTSKPYAEVSDRSCLQRGCHSQRLLSGKEVLNRGVIFDHAPHLREMRGGMKLRCTSCHSQIVIGTHVEVTYSTCYLCHFRGSKFRTRKEGRPLDGCTLCHPLPGKSFLGRGGVKVRHKEFFRRGIECRRCHASVIQGRGEVSKDRCFDCHNEPWKLSNFGDREFMHIAHTALHRVDCERCHTPIRHEHAPGQAVADRPDACEGCHAKTHNPQQLLYLGQGGEGVEEMPNPMVAFGISCPGCHIIPKHQPEKGKFTGQTLASGALPCYSCHGYRYKALLSLFNTRLAEMLDYVGEQLDRQWRSFRSPGFLEVAADRALIYGLLKRAQSNYELVKGGKGIHNPFYALELLRASTRFLKEADESTGARPTGRRVPVGLREEGCQEVCHGALPPPRLLQVKFPKPQPSDPRKVKVSAPADPSGTFPHDLHVARGGSPCGGCHRGQHLSWVPLKSEECSACHHQSENGQQKSCPKCHLIQ